MKDNNSRSKNSLTNASVALFYFIITNIFSFVMKIVLTRFIGIEYAGLNSLLTNIIGILNIAELGLSVAIGYSLYKPLANNDYETINEILYLYRYLYRIISVFILIAGIIVTIFIGNFVNTTIALNEIRICFLLYIIVTIASYLLTYLTVLPSANQKNYLIVKIQNNGKIIKNILQIISIILFKNFYIWLVIEIIVSIIIYLYTNIVIRKKYPWYNQKENYEIKSLLKKYKSIVKSTRNLFFHKIGALAVYQTDVILISYFTNLKESGIYSNYILIYTLLTGVTEQMFNGITASIGNLIIKKDEKKTFSIWKEMYVFTLYASLICGILFYLLANPFIKVCFGDNLTFSNTIVLCIVINTVFRIIKNPIDKFKEAYGIFWDIYAPIIEAIVNLVSSVILAIHFGLIGIVIGTIISNVLITIIWKPYVIFKYGFKEKMKKFVYINIKYILIGLVGVAITYFVCTNIHFTIKNEIVNLLLLFITNIIISTIIITTVFSLDKYFKELLKKYINLVVSFVKRTI